MKISLTRKKFAKAYRQNVWEHEKDGALMDSFYWACRQAVRHDPHFTDAYFWLTENIPFLCKSFNDVATVEPSSGT